MKPTSWTLENTFLTKLLGKFFELHNCIVLFFSIQHFGKLGINLNGLVLLDS